MTESPAVPGGVTVVIPAHQAARHLPEALRSALGQSRKPDEIIVVDDGSTDGTAGVAAGFAPHGVRYIRQSNRGPASARNTGAVACSTEFVVFLDADDRLAPDYIERTLPLLLDADPFVGYLYTQCRYFGAAEGTSSFPPWSARRLMRGNFVHVSALLRTEMVLAYPFDESLRSGLEDWDFYLTLAEHGISGVLCDAPLLWYRKHGGGSRNDSLDADPGATARLSRAIQRRHWRLGGPVFAVRAELWYLRTGLAGRRREQVPSLVGDR